MATILLVDDNAFDRLLIATVLRPAGHRILQAAGGEEGLALAHAERPDLVVSDIVMPSMDGYRFARLLRSDPATVQTRLVFNTASDPSHRLESLAKACGVQAILPKPSDPQKIARVLTEALAAEVAPMVPDESFDQEHLRVITDRLFEKVSEADSRRREQERLQTDLERRMQQQEALADLGRRALAAASVDDVLEDALDTCIRVLGVEHAMILELLPPGESLLLRAGRGWASGLVGTATVDAVKDSYATYTLRTGVPVVVSDFAEEMRFSVPPLLRDHHIASGISAVIGSGSALFGVLGVHSTRALAVDADDVSFVQSVANVVADAVRRAKMDEVMRRSERMESLGRLAGGVAHDFNNVLAVISGYANLIAGRVSDADLVRDLDRVQSAVERAGGLVRQLLVFSRRETTDPAVIDLGVVVDDIRSLVARTIDSRIELITDVPPTWPVLADRSKLDQVMLNLVVNARDAMPSGGTITMALANVTANGDSPLGLAAGRYVRLTIADTGTGMTSDVRSRAFEPFFTTKKDGEGTGLGLATVYGIAVDAGGWVDLDSAPGRGTAIHVYLPATQAPKPPG